MDRPDVGLNRFSQPQSIGLGRPRYHADQMLHHGTPRHCGPIMVGLAALEYRIFLGGSHCQDPQC